MNLARIYWTFSWSTSWPLPIPWFILRQTLTFWSSWSLLCAVDTSMQLLTQPYFTEALDQTQLMESRVDLQCLTGTCVSHSWAGKSFGVRYGRDLGFPGIEHVHIEQIELVGETLCMNRATGRCHLSEIWLTFQDLCICPSWQSANCLNLDIRREV